MVALTELESSFWGLCLEAGKKYSQTVEKGFHITMAAVDPHKCKGSEPITLYLEKGETEYVLCTLVPNKLNQQQLDLTFSEGEDVNLFIREKGSVHLTGYLELDDMEDDFTSDLEEEEDYEDADEEIVMEGKKRKLKSEMVGGKRAKNEMTGDEDDDMSEEEKPKVVQKQEKKKEKKNAQPDNKKQKKETPVSAEKSVAEGTSGSEKKKKKKNKNKEEQKQGKLETATDDKAEKPTKKTVKGGVIVEDIKVGHGPEAVNGKRLKMFYTGKLLSGKVFDSTTSGAPFAFKLGGREVIPGWDVGILGMKVGGKRKLTIPPAMAYGKAAVSGIPGNSTLTFEVELKAVN